MKQSSIRITLVGILLLGLTLPAVASAGWFNWGCRYQGTWFGVVAEDNPAYLSGWLMNIEGKSFFYGTNDVEFTAVALPPSLPVIDPATGAIIEVRYPLAVRATSNRGNWMRIGYNRLAWTMTGFGLDANGLPLYVAMGKGEVTLNDDCSSAVITAEAFVYDVVYDEFGRALIPNPLIGPPVFEPRYTIEFPPQYAYRAFVDLQ